MDELQLIVTGYALTIARGAIDRVGGIAQTAAPAHRYAVIADDVTGPLYAHRILATLPAERTLELRFGTGEEHKSRATWMALTDQLLDAGCGRDTTIIALGGGVVGDLAGFVAATFLRGVPLVQVPTTLLAMIDSSIGGKTGVDTAHGKNLVGAFHRPSAVIADPALLSTLPIAHLRAGLAEALKHAVIADASLFDWIELHSAELLDDPGGPHMTELIARAVSIKARVVEADERESGLRKTLNLGHTVGHAVEQLSGYSLLHGEAVAIGMVAETRAAETVGIAEPGMCDRVIEALERLELPTRVPRNLPTDRILALMRTDKKAREGLVEYALPRRIGEMAGAAQQYGIPLEDSVVRSALDAGRD
jgi:3-dehydroquinate synthase